MVYENLHGLNPQIDAVLKKDGELAKEMDSVLEVFRGWQKKFFDLLPADYSSWRDETFFQTLTVDQIVTKSELALTKLAQERDGSFKAEALRVLGLANGDIHTALARLKSEIGPRLRTLASAREIYRPTVAKACEDGIRLLAERARKKHDAIRREIVLNIFALAESLREEREFRAELGPGVGVHLVPPPPDVQKIATHGGLSALSGYTIGQYVSKALSDGVVKGAELPAHWSDLRAGTQ